jgi:translocation and assembly module TamB
MLPITLQLTARRNGAMAIDELVLALPIGRVTGDALFATPDRTIAGHLRASLPDLAAFSASPKPQSHGSAEIELSLSGTESQPHLELTASGDDLSAAGSVAEHADAHLDVTTSGTLGTPAARIAAEVVGRVTGVASLAGTQLPASLDRDFTFSLKATSVPADRAVELTELAAHGGGLDFVGSGRFDPAKQLADGRLQFTVADLRPFSGLAGRPIGGAVSLGATANQTEPDRVAFNIDGKLTHLRTSTPAVDALTGDTVTINGTGERDPAGIVRVSQFSVKGAGVNLSASGQFDPAHDGIAAALTADVPRLASLAESLAVPMSGRLSAQLQAEGPIRQAHLQAKVEANELAVGASRLDRLQLTAAVAEINRKVASLNGSFQGGGLDGTLALEADAQDPAEIAIRGLQLKAADSAVEGELHLNPARMLARGSIRANLPDLARWSRLAGVPLAGGLSGKADLDAQGGQNLDLTVNADRLSTGNGGSRLSIARMAATAHLRDILATPSGKAQATLTGVTFPSGDLASATLTLDGPRPGHFAFTADARGKVIDPTTLTLGGEADIAPATGAIDLRVARLSGAFGPDRFQLTRPLRLTQHGNDLALSDLALSFGQAQLNGNASRRGQALSAQLSLRNFALATAGRFAGLKDLGGTLGFDATLSGSMAAPQARYSLTGRSLRFAIPNQARLPSLSLDIAGGWDGRELTANGGVGGLKGERIAFNGSVPLVLRPAPFSLSMPAQGRLAMRVQGAGELGNLADLLPLGEDRLTGRFALDLTAGGTIANPTAGGQVTITDGRYESFATGAVVSRLKLDLAGDRDRLVLREFSGSDSANGTLAAQGSVVLTGAAPSADMKATLQQFRIAARDEAVVTASGSLTVAGPLASPKITAQLTTDKGELTIPDRLPPSVRKINVVETNGRTAPKPAPAPPAKKAEPPALPATLAIELSMPGQVFVRGRGLDSEWGGRIKVAGTSAVPQISGSLNIQRGTFDFLGKTFKITKGRISFDGSGNVDPTLDIVAEVTTADITAQVILEGPASSPKIRLTSSPVVPQDEILARVLFNRGLDKITAAEGIQVAQTAATLAGGGVGVLDRMRGRLGLDRLLFGSAPAGTASSSLNPASGGSATGSAALSGGKYVAPGVYVGATQGLTPQSSKMSVEIEVRPHVTVQTDVSQAGGTGLGLNYKYDY